MRLIVKVALNYNCSNVRQPAVEAVIPEIDAELKRSLKRSKNPQWGYFELQHVSDLRLERFLSVQFAFVLSGRYLQNIYVKCVSKVYILGEAVSSRDHHALGHDRPSADLFTVLVDSHVPGNFRPVCDIT